MPTKVYYRSGPGLAVSLYTPSSATIALQDGVSLKVRQETDYPSSGHVVIRLDPSRPTKFPLQLRIPRWCKNAAVTLNGQPWPTPIAAGQFLTIERRWTAGDQVTLDMPMTWRLVLGRKRQSGRAAVMRGPVVYCLNPAQNEAICGQNQCRRLGGRVNGDRPGFAEGFAGRWDGPARRHGRQLSG